MGTLFLLLIGVILALIASGILFGVGALHEWRRWSDFWQHMVMIEGHITRLDIGETTDLEGNKASSYQAEYSYHYEGKDYMQVQSVSGKHYRTWRPDTVVIVRVASNHPDHANLQAQASLLGDTAIVWGFSLAGLFCFGCAVLVFVLLFASL